MTPNSNASTPRSFYDGVGVGVGVDEHHTTGEHAIILQEDVLRLQMELNKTMEQYKRFGIRQRLCLSHAHLLWWLRASSVLGSHVLYMCVCLLCTHQRMAASGNIGVGEICHETPVREPLRDRHEPSGEEFCDLGVVG